MNTTELKEIVSEVMKKESGLTYTYETNYGEGTKPTFRHRKQLSWIETKNRYEDEIDQNYLICTADLHRLIQLPAAHAKHHLRVVKAKPELWIDGVKYMEGTTLYDALDMPELRVVAHVSNGCNYHILSEVIEMVGEWEKGGVK